LQFAPWHAQMPALQLHVPDVLQIMLHELPSHVQLLESLHVTVQLPFGDSHFASHVSEPLHAKLHGPV
jgi:hypothetical protein